MENFTKIVLELEKKSIIKRAGELRRSMDSLENSNSDYYEHHKHLLNFFNEMEGVIDFYIAESEKIGLGV